MSKIIIIHYEPLSPDSLYIAIPLQDNYGTISEHFGSSLCCAFVYYDVQEDTMSRKEILSNPYQ